MQANLSIEEQIDACLSQLQIICTVLFGTLLTLPAIAWLGASVFSLTEKAKEINLIIPHELGLVNLVFVLLIYFVRPSLLKRSLNSKIAMPNNTLGVYFWSTILSYTLWSLTVLTGTIISIWTQEHIWVFLAAVFSALGMTLRWPSEDSANSILRL